MEGFEYVVVRPKKPKVCFGSSIERDCLPLKGPAKTSFMKKFIPEPTPSPGPGTYHKELAIGKLFPSKLGYTAFASKTPQITPTPKQKVPPVGTYGSFTTTEERQIEPPFGLVAKQLTGLKPTSTTPGPGSIKLYERKRKIHVCMAFGTRKFNIPPAQAICTPSNMSKCWKCSAAPLVGDYYRNFTTGLDLCLLCMQKELKLAKLCGSDVIVLLHKRKENAAYSLVRYCGFYHNHYGTKCAVQHMPTKTYRFKLKKEYCMSLFGYSMENVF